MDIASISTNQSVRLGVVGSGCTIIGILIGYKLGQTRSVYVPAEPVNKEVNTQPTESKHIDDDQLGLEFEGDLVHINGIIDIDGLDIDQEDLALLRETLDTAREQAAATKPEVRNVFAQSDKWDYEAELVAREKASGKPHIIHQDEFFAQESEYTQTTCTYYVGDDILVDEKDVPVHNHTLVVGELRFGHGSLDPNVVYVRNTSLKGEYEILKHDGFYTIEVLGYEQESHLDEADARPTLRRFKED